MATGSAAPRYWFPAKRYGWGWGAPSCWQGWAALAAFALILVTGALLFPPARQPLAFAALCLMAVTALFVVCLKKGEPPRWRWGDR